ncbi:VOC family protein [Cohnella thailandensis]|uniref:VOC family protein n=1 Tax=Cohnella thailandensis TaxID=557557 RepID=A0A841SMB7_9BACL|nr:VOC family protein [Cohnella thailandensis]MBB6633074.1 VOC family protein [Cohnella thailandensis]MBP1975231.1 PhnB protein [Cohnella thailandensis]
MIATPFITVENCKDEIKHYQSVFGGEIEILRKQGEAVLNADLHAKGATLKFADTLAAKPVQKGDYVRVFLRIETEEEFRRIYGELSVSGIINAEAYEAPFNGLLAIVTDRNGVCWVLSHYRA